MRQKLRERGGGTNLLIDRQRERERESLCVRGTNLLIDRQRERERERERE